MTVRADSDPKDIRVNNRSFGLGSGSEIDKFLNLLIFSILFNVLYFSTGVADEFRETIKKRWKKLRSKTSTLEQRWLSSQPSRNAWSDSREFNKVNLVKVMVGYKPKIETKNDVKCMDEYLRVAPESELVMTNLGQNNDFLPVWAPLLDFLTVDTKGSLRWK